jgi:hypothetical protein
MRQSPDKSGLCLCVYIYISRNIQTLSPKFDCVNCPCFSTTTMPPSPPPSLSACDQRAANRNASLPVLPAKPKSTSWKRQQSNADESANKHNKTVVNDSDDGMDDATMDAAIAVEEANEAGKGGKKGKKAKKTGAKGKTMYLFYFPPFVLF